MACMQIKALPRYGDRKVELLLEAVEKSRSGSAALLLSGLGISDLGATMSTPLLQHVGSVEVRS